MEILIGTNNENKLKQFKRIFRNLGFEAKPISLREAGIFDDVEEDADNLLDNAIKKAKFYAEKSGMVTMADDTGLFIDALGGDPGVHAKRWLEGSEKDRYLKILERMEGVPLENRTCRYRGVLALYDPTKQDSWTYEGNLEGVIAMEPFESNGFGYDPIVIVKAFDKYYSTLTDEERDSISHRGLGIKELQKHINQR